MDFSPSSLLVYFMILVVITVGVASTVRYVQVSRACDGVVVKVVEFGDGLACVSTR